MWLRGGFPESVLASSDAASLDWRRDFVRSYLERDVPMFRSEAWEGVLGHPVAGASWEGKANLVTAGRPYVDAFTQLIVRRTR